MQLANEAGADFVGGDELIEKIKRGLAWFRRAIASRPMMPKIARTLDASVKRFNPNPNRNRCG